MKNVVLSSVAAVAVVGMLALSGCGGNSGSSKGESKNIFDPSKGNAQDSEKLALNVDKEGNSQPKSSAQGDKNAFTVTLRDVKGTRGCNDDNSNPGCNQTCEVAAEKNDPCKVEVQRKCTEAGEKLDYKSESVKSAFEALDALGVKATDGKSLRYAGFFKTFTEDDIDDCKIYIKADLDCSLGRDNRGVYLNKDTVEDGSRVVVVVTDKTGKKKDVTGILHYHNPNGTGAYVSFEGKDGIDISGFDADSVKLSFFVEEKEVIKDPHDVWSGATGGDATGATN